MNGVPCLSHTIWERKTMWCGYRNAGGKCFMANSGKNGRIVHELARQKESRARAPTLTPGRSAYLPEVIPNTSG